jgi:prophage regulatory protein
MLMNMEALVGSQELTRLLGVGRARVYQISNADDFPKPAAILAMGSIWRLDDIKKWAANRGRTLNLDALYPPTVEADEHDDPAVQRKP